ncbi:hypothetical protein Xmau_03088 [Xenorhabdus mauleonii]|uniref:Uncharacterized protein n=1 Tax=Xenorhabdus mauleonii TaxID=351675 RepID=A0A1I3SK96_9GAMM|nr:hypothetical protein [Xenorhabdus mauleonii]PHM39181.1 hypothetical protein Xmau_03088 [Xenorhabdus mauleonii]SFJ57876.1 hypothetical protein SAMN05421680_111109 [Xenorhabdus mauleonii]
MKPVQDISLDFWKEELSSLVASAKTEEELAALIAFEKALSPYLDKPGSLRTLLGKIQAPTTSAIDAIIAEGSFQNLNELKAVLPKDIEIVTV